MDTKARASCLCGGMVAEVDLYQILMVNNCHCSNCRKVSDGATAPLFRSMGLDFNGFKVLT